MLTQERQAAADPEAARRDLRISDQVPARAGQQAWKEPAAAQVKSHALRNRPNRAKEWAAIRAPALGPPQVANRRRAGRWAERAPGRGQAQEWVLVQERVDPEPGRRAPAGPGVADRTGAGSTRVAHARVTSRSVPTE